MTGSGVTELRWRALPNAPRASSRTDDIWFVDARRGWAVNSNGHILHTADGGETWERQASILRAYLRCVGFVDERRGWVGTLDARQRLLHTADGGATWTTVTGLPPETPPAICGLSVVNERVAYGSGTNEPALPTGVIKTVDGGATWTAQDMGIHATLLVDVFFRDERRGWVVGGKAPDGITNPDRDDVTPVVLATVDGGATWDNRLAAIADELRRGEWGWKIQFVTEDVGFVSLEAYDDAAILKTTDGGRTWTRKPVDDPQNNANLEGIGFVDERVGWVGGWGDAQFEGGFTSTTRDGGETWQDANSVGKFLNRFRFIREPELIGYASGDTIYKYAAAPAAPETERAVAPPQVTRARLPVRIPIDVPVGAGTLRVDLWDRFGRHLATPADLASPPAGAQEVSWSGETESGRGPHGGIVIARVTIDDDAESRTLLVED
jgi:photosystem II stability/assembly factor-like uncharacterized protein